MSLKKLILQAREAGASDLHLEASLPPAMRIDGTLRPFGEPLSPEFLLEEAQAILGETHWPFFLEQRSFDTSRNLGGIRCRLNILHTTRGVGFAIRLLTSFQATLERLNLHPDLRKLTTLPNGLVLVSGPTGCGKSTTLAALIQEINLSEVRHIVTLESPVEYVFTPKHSFIRQREVGRDTPSFERGLLDALREDPDVLMVGEMREPETIRLTLQAAETGHLVFATVHSGSAAEALQRVVLAFPPEIQHGMKAALADCLQAVVCQRLHYRPDLKIRVPVCEILMPTHPVKHFIRQGEFFKIISQMETGAENGMWTFTRYQKWLDSKSQWNIPGASDLPAAEEAEEVGRPTGKVLPPLPARTAVSTPKSTDALPKPAKAGPKSAIDIEPVEGGLSALIKKLTTDGPD